MARLSSAFPAATREPCSLRRRLFETRRLSLDLARPLSAEDMTVQAMDDASPTKWHLAHTTWFFETFVLASDLNGYQPFDEAFNYCFNSYYRISWAAAAALQAWTPHATVERSHLSLPRPRGRRARKAFIG